MTRFEILSRFLAQGGAAGTQKRFSSSFGGRDKTADDDGFAYAAPQEVSYKGCLIQLRRTYNLRLLRKLRHEGVRALGPGATEADVQRVAERSVLIIHLVCLSGFNCLPGTSIIASITDH